MLHCTHAHSPPKCGAGRMKIHTPLDELYWLHHRSSCATLREDGSWTKLASELEHGKRGTRTHVFVSTHSLTALQAIFYVRFMLGLMSRCELTWRGVGCEGQGCTCRHVHVVHWRVGGVPARLRGVCDCVMPSEEELGARDVRWHGEWG